ncbi:hypothetical protein ACJ41O_010241 [Fusarium nematophilum]
MIKFVVGPGEKVSFIHKDLVARQSRALDVLVNGPMVEAQEGCVRWKDVDEETFNRFFRFMYTGDYAGAKPTLRDGLRAEEEDGEEDEEEEEEEEEEEDEEEDEEEEEPPIPGERPTTGSEYTPWMYFSSGPDRRTHSAMSTTFAGLFNGEEHECGKAFVSHAKVYLFAECYGIEELKRLSAMKLWQLLGDYRVDEAGVADVVYLVDFVYGNTAGELLPGCEQLGRVVSVFAACCVEKLWEGEEFRELVKEGGEFVVALMREMMTRYRDPDESIVW